MYSGYCIAFDTANSWSFSNEFVGWLLVLDVVLGERPTDDLYRSVGSAEPKFCINFTKAKINIFLRLHYNHDKNYLFVDGKEIYNSKGDNKMSTF